MILPGGTIGILGGGQLGRMLIQAGRPMGYRFHIFCPEAESTAGRIADTFTQANYDDFEALERFARSVDCITFEFENIPSDSLNKLSEITPYTQDQRPTYLPTQTARKRFSKIQTISLRSV